MVPYFPKLKTPSGDFPSTLKYGQDAFPGATRRTNDEYAKIALVDEGRKRVLLIAASILAARKLAQFEGGKRVPATLSAIADAVRWAEEIMKAIDERFPSGR